MAWCGRSTKSKNLEGLSEEEKNSKGYQKGTDKLEYYLGDAVELIENGYFKEMATLCKRTDEKLGRLNDPVSQMQELKLERDVYTPREVRQVRQWKKDTKTKFSPFVDKRELVDDAGEEGETESPTDRE